VSLLDSLSVKKEDAMYHLLNSSVVFLVALALCTPALAQDDAVDIETETPVTSEPAATQPETTLPEATQPAATQPANSIVTDAAKKIDEVVGQVESNAQAQEAKSGILAPIYALAEGFSFSAFHWLAFTLMVTGVVSFALQLVLGKLFVLARMGFSATEILSDGLGLAVSTIGLVLTTQAATENSSFTTSAIAVLSATAVGALLGLVFYVWGQRQELEAVAGRRAAVRTPAAKDKPART
jgi:hypothetical protein